MEKEKVVIEMKDGRMAVLSLLEFDSEMSVDDVLRIDYSNILGEVLTFPVIYNRIGNLKAEMESILALEKLDMEVFEAQLSSEHKKTILASGEKATEKSLEMAVLLDSRYSIKKKHLISVQKNLAYVDALYWAAQSKDSKLNKLTEKLRPEEFEKELLEDTINGVAIKITKAVI